MRGDNGKRVRRTSIRTKLLVGLAVPVLFVALISGFQARTTRDALIRTQDEVALAMAAGGPTTYITALLDERNITALTLLNLTSAVKLDRVENMAQARQLTDSAQADFAESLASGGTEVQALYQGTFDNARSKLTALRTDIDGVPEDQRGTQFMEDHEQRYDAFTDLIEAFHTANTAAVGRIDDAQLRNRAESIASQTRSSDLLSLMSRTAAMSFLQKPADDNERMERSLLMQSRWSEFEASRAQAVGDLDGAPKARAVMAGFYDREPMQEFYAGIERFIAQGDFPPAEVPDLIANAADVSFPNGTDAWQAARSALQQRGDSLIAAAETTRDWYFGLFAFATLLSLALALVISRSIGRPLMSIARQAEKMADERLPDAVGTVLATPMGQDIVEPELEPITVPGRDEVAEVAASINAVQQRALDLAVDQAAQRRNFADTFLNLGRRVQGLVARQLDFITELEDSEDDPDVLEDLFRLDHLATRIRRNAESLIVLVGVTRRQRRGEPAPVMDALRSALSEVDEYTRVAIGAVDDARLPGSVAADVAHILAELIENGLNFSPPESTVEVTGRRSDHGYEITVVDQGIGMDSGQVATANRRLSGQESFTVAPSRYMGHYVAGHLAAALNIEVAVASFGRGTKASVRIPPNLLITRELPRSSVEPSTPGVDPGMVARVTPSPWPRAEDLDTAPADPAASLGSLLTAHRRLSSATGGTPDQSPWAPRQDLAPVTGDDEPTPS